MSRLLIGLPGLKGKLENYAKRYDLVELQPLDNPLPPARKLAAWRASVPPAFAFSIRLPRVIAGLAAGPAFEAALNDSVAAATALQARCILLATPASIRPTKANRKRIAELAERLPRTGHLLAWEATGIWEADEHQQVARAAGWLPVVDAAQQPLPPGPIAYTRIRALGLASHLGADRIAQLAEQLEGRNEAFVVVDQAIVGRVRAGLKQAFDATEGSQRVPQLFRPAAFDADDEEQ